MNKTYIVGVGLTKFEKAGTKADDYPIWVKEVVEKALSDAKIDYSKIEQVFASYVFGDSGSANRAIQEVGLTGIPLYNINGNCSSGSSSIHLAKQFIEIGKNDCVLVMGFEKMDKYYAFAKFKDREQPVQNHVRALAKLTDYDENISVPVQLFGHIGIEHMKKYGTTVKHLAKIAHKNRKHAVNNPNAVFQKEYTVKEILDSPKTFGPLTRLQCSALSDGAAAVILASERFVRKHSLQSQAIEILGMELVTDFPSTFNTTSSFFPIGGYDITKEAADRLFKKTNRTPNDVQVVELHDSFSTFELMLYEALGLCPPGKAGELVDSGDNTYGGKYVINPSGGLMGKGHPYGATGIAQCIEICLQLRGEAGKRQVEGVKLALQHNIGMAAAVVVALYQRASLE